MILQKTQAILVEIQYGCMIVQKNHFVLNCPGKWWWEQYQKHQPIEPTINWPIELINQLNQNLTNQTTK